MQTLSTSSRAIAALGQAPAHQQRSALPASPCPITHRSASASVAAHASTCSTSSVACSCAASRASDAPCPLHPLSQHASRRGALVCTAANPAYLPGVANAPAFPDDEDDESDVLSPENEFSVYTRSTITYAMSLARAAETYTVHPWFFLLGLLKQEDCTACKVLKSLGLDDAYGAWHEVLWALRVSDGLERKPFMPEISFTDRAYKVLKAAVRYAHWGGRKKIQTEDLLLALAASSALDGIFPDLNLNFGHVRAGVERVAGGRYVLPFDDDSAQSENVF